MSVSSTTWNVSLSVSVCETATGVDGLCVRDILVRWGSTKLQRVTSNGNIAYCSERICEPVESETVKRGDFNVNTDACADKASRRTGNKENIEMTCKRE